MQCLISLSLLGSDQRRDGQLYHHIHVAVGLISTSRVRQCAYSHLFPLRSITAILVSRFLLQIQEAGQEVVRVDSDDPLHISMDERDDTPSFIRSLGAVVDQECLRDENTVSSSDSRVLPGGEEANQNGDFGRAVVGFP